MRLDHVDSKIMCNKFSVITEENVKCTTTSSLIIRCLHSSHPFITRIFRKLSWTPHQVNDEDFQYLESFVCPAYDIQCRFNTNDINKL